MARPTSRIRKGSTGFTIVELLIVVVVIAILAAITIVAYNGIQDRAKAARITASIDAYGKALELYRVENGNYPTVSSGCLGVAADYPASGAFSAGACVMSGSTADTTYSTSLGDSLASYQSSRPSALLDPVTIDYGYGMIYHYRGVWVESDDDSYQFQYVLRGNVSCPIGTKTYFAASNASRCNVAR